MILYTNGCSITHGYLVGFENSWANILSKNNNLDLINDSQCGVGNDYIFHKSLESITKLINEKKKPELVIIQWSGPNRRLHCDIDGNYYYVNLTDHIKYQPKYEPMGSEHTLHYMFCLHSFLEKNNIPYLFFNYMDLNNSIKKLEIYNEIDWTKSILINRNLLISKKYIHDNEGHPNTAGHLYIANVIAKKLNINYNIISDSIQTII
jgi:hypothetical protein